MHCHEDETAKLSWVHLLQNLGNPLGNTRLISSPGKHGIAVAAQWNFISSEGVAMDSRNRKYFVGSRFADWSIGSISNNSPCNIGRQYLSNYGNWSVIFISSSIPCLWALHPWSQRGNRAVPFRGDMERRVMWAERICLGICLVRCDRDSPLE